MGLGCARCGDCCNPVFLDASNRDCVDKWRGYIGGTEVGGDSEFIHAHWTEIERGEQGATYECDRYDPGTRSCTAHEDRPRVCSDYPWYGKPPGPGRAQDMHRRCSYLLDVAPADRGPDARPLIPLMVKAAV